MSDENQDTGAEATISVEAELDSLREGVDDPQVLKGQLAKEAQARRQVTARAKKAEDELRIAKQKLAEKEAQESVSQTTTTSNTETSTDSVTTEDERLELRLDGYSKEEVSFIMANGGRKALENDKSFVATAINARREQAKAESAASGTDTSGGEDNLQAVDFAVSREPSAKELRESIAKMEKSLPHAG